MGRCSSKSVRALAFAFVAAGCAVGSASALADHETGQSAASAVQSRVDSGPRTAAPLGAAPDQHGPLSGHLPPIRDDLEVVGKLEPTRQFEDIVEGQIADLAVHEGWAYLNSWDEPACTRGGTYIADIRDPANPEDVGFIPARRGYYHGEGAHVVSLSTPEFQGDLLAVNDEPCSNDSTRPDDVPADAGGFDLYDVSDPERWKVLVRNAGDRSDDEGSLEQLEDYANSYHSVFVWQDGPRAYLVGVDNTELHDVDIFDITDPREPEFIADIDLVELADAQGVDIISLSANSNNVFHHDMVVKRIGGQLRMLISYWDAGYVQVNVDDPRNPVYLSDTDFDEPDLLTGFEIPEGNAHQSEYSHDNQFFLAADEDFAPDRVDSLGIEGLADPRAASVVAGGASSSILEDGVLNGPTYYGGYGCVESAPVPERSAIDPVLEAGEEAILVLQRGPSGDPQNTEEACFPGEKAQVAVDAGWDAVLLINRHVGGPDDDSANCGSGGFTSATVAVCTTHAAGHEIFGQAPGFEYGPGHMPALGAAGAKVDATPSFDGWGYAHLYDAETGDELDAYAIPEALDPRFASGFGDLSIHEFATDPTENLAYSSYYSGGIRVMRFSRAGGIEPVGAWIDEGGSNFWGVEQFTTPAGERLIAGSDRDFGLVILRYTGPGAAQPPSCQAAAAATESGTPVRVPLACSDANGNPLTLRIAGGPANGSLGSIEAGGVLYTPNAGFAGSDTFTFSASDGAADSAAATASVQVAAPAAPPTPPVNRYTTRLGEYRNGRLVVVVNVPGPGVLNVGLQANLPGASRVVRLASSVKRPKAAGSVRVTLKASKAKRRQLKKALARSRRGRVTGKVNTAFTPTGGTPRRSSRRIIIGG